jgi:hypothetical protein
LFNDILSAVDVMKYPKKDVDLMSGELERIREEVIMVSFVNAFRRDVYLTLQTPS